MGPVRCDMTPRTAVSEVPWEELVAAIPGTLFRLVVHGDTQWQLTQLSAGAAALLGADADTLLEQPHRLLELLHPDDLDAVRAAWARRCTEDQLIDVECRVREHSGAHRWVHLRAVSQREASGAIAWSGLLSDATARKEAEAALLASEAVHRSLFETIAQGVVFQDLDGRITAANPAAERILGLSLDQMQGRTSIDPRWCAVHEDGSPFPGDEHPAMMCLRTQTPVHDVVMGVDAPERGRVWIQVNARPLFIEGVMHEVYTSFEDITARTALAEELRRKATTDFLTGILNRRSFEERLDDEAERVRRHPEVSSCVLVFDIDHFKRVNDEYGHPAGDAVLRHVTEVVAQVVRRIDHLGRIGGEEFAVLMPSTTIDEALYAAERIRLAVAEAPAHYWTLDIPVTISGGVSRMRADDADPHAVLSRADRALYRAKRGGRNSMLIALT
jgi:diguanylate cyclase (GGDEF)-like protein/PAS domain S-box-containing protein